MTYNDQVHLNNLKLGLIKAQADLQREIDDYTTRLANLDDPVYLANWVKEQKQHIWERIKGSKEQFEGLKVNYEAAVALINAPVQLTVDDVQAEVVRISDKIATADALVVANTPVP